jgi:hypothetical protein
MTRRYRMPKMDTEMKLKKAADAKGRKTDSITTPVVK